MFLWDGNAYVSSANISFIKVFDALNRSFIESRKRSGLSIGPWTTPQIISRQLFDTSWKDMYCFLLLR